MKTSKLINFFKNHSYLSVFLFILIFWFLLFITSGSLFSGYHFTDDHEIVHINYNFSTQKMNVFEVVGQWLQNDYLTGRFRPFYYIHRIIQTKLLGLNFLLWSIYNGLLAVLTTFFLFVFGRAVKFSTNEAVLFSFLITLGAQSAVWWQLGPAETIGTFLLSAALMLALLSEIFERYKLLYEISFITCVLMMSLSKESFILIIPAIAFIKIVLSQKVRILPWYQAIKRNSLSIISLALIFCVEILIIKLSLGLTPDIGYAGVDKFSISAIISTAKSFNQAGYWWIILASLITIILLMARDSSKPRFWTLNVLYIPIILFFLVVIPQTLLYTKSGISQRYFLPGILGFAFLIIELYQYLNMNYELGSKLILLLIMISLGCQLSLAWEAAHTFAMEGKSTNSLLQTIESNTTLNDSILITTNSMVYYEWNLSIKKYLNYVSQRSNVYLATYGSKESKFYRILEKIYDYRTLKRIKNTNDIRCVVTFPQMNRIFSKNSPWFMKNKFEEYNFGNFNRNLNKNSKIYLYCKK